MAISYLVIFITTCKDASMANTRVLTIGVSGLIGGPWVAIIVGIISGLCRLYIGLTHIPILFHP